VADRVALALSCRDTDAIPKVEHAGEIVEAEGGAVQLMHNGVRIMKGCYYGDWMTEIIRGLRGHHEPQEEAAFHLVVERLRQDTPAPVMLECGAFWAYYSLWLLERVPTGRTILVEPDENNLRVGEANFRLNDRQGTFVNAAIGATRQPAVTFRCESDGAERPVPVENLPSLWMRLGLERVDLLHIDAQGAEIPFLESGSEILSAGRVRCCVVSTHHHSISGDPLAHERCLRLFLDLGAHVIAEHTVAESFSGDGLVCASFDPRDQTLEARLSRARARDGLFGDPLVDLARCWQLRDTGQKERRSAGREATLVAAARRRLGRWRPRATS
jgi:FkbM family methyltransferase